MSAFFPDDAEHTRSADAAAFRRITFSVIEMAIIAGVLLRVVRVVVNTHGGPFDWHAFLGKLIISPLILFGLATLHLANFPVRQWLWRAPAFAFTEGAAEAVVSALLIWAGREMYGRSVATVADWPSMAAGVLLWRMVAVVLFALLLGGIVQWARSRAIADDRGNDTDQAGDHTTAPPQPARRREDRRL